MTARPLILLASVAVLGALSLPALSVQRERAHRLRCLANQRAIWEAMNLYAADYRGWLPALSPLVNGSRREGENGFNRHAGLLLGRGYLRPASRFVCPSDHEDGNPRQPFSADGASGHARVRVARENLQWFNVSYVYVAGLTVRDPGEFLVLADEHWDSEGDCPAECSHDLDPFDNHGKAGRNVLFLDGHGHWLPGVSLAEVYQPILKQAANYRTRTVD
jgi:prepilin-type processing-associated H-X9-DG protein